MSDTEQHPAQPQTLSEHRIAELINNSNHEQDTRIKDYLNVKLDGVKKELIDAYKEAFPEGDIHAHRIHHEKKNRDESRWEDVKTEFMSKAFGGALLSATVFVAMLVWDYLKNEAKK